MCVSLRFGRYSGYGPAILCEFPPGTRIDTANAPGSGRFAVFPEADAGQSL